MSSIRLGQDDIDRLSDRQIEEYAPALIPKWSKYIPHAPTDRQWAFMLLDNQEALYGGAAGGGKSDALLMAALQYAEVPGYAALLLRRTYADLERPGSLIPRSIEWLKDTDAHWNGRRWTFPSGAVLDFGYLDNEVDKYNYQSAEYQFIGFDELTQFLEPWYRYLFSRTRRLKSMTEVPIRMRGATNPGGVGAEWVHQRFIVEGPQNGRVFIPARLEDNPHIDQDEYDRSLQALDEITRLQLRYGDWGVKAPGAFFARQWFEVVEDPPPGLRWIRMWDIAATKRQSSAYTAGVKMARGQHGEFFIGDIRRMKGNPGEVDQFIRQTATLDGRGVEVWAEQEPGSGGVNTIWKLQREVLVGYSVRPYLPRLDKLARARPFSSAARSGAIKLIRGNWINAFLDEAEAFPNGFKDQIDACSASHATLSMTPEMKIRRL